MKLFPLKSSPKSRPALSAKSKTAFTLIELLVVISIIAVLMGLLFPVIGSVMNTAKKAEAKNDAMQIVTAIKSYYTEYGRYPILTPAATELPLTQPQLVQLYAILRADTSTANVTAVDAANPRRHVFLEGKDAKTATSPKSGFSGGVWYDPWGQLYKVAFDADYDNMIANKPETTGFTLNAAPAGTPPNGGIRTGVIAWSTGIVKDGQSTGEGATDQKKAIVSWQ